MTTPNEILTFWFGKEPFEARDAWFQGGPAFDEECRIFSPTWERAQSGELSEWLKAPDTLLPFVILTDQIPRNIFREDARAFATDAMALKAAQTAVANGWDKSMNQFQRVFLYLPFEHSEDLAMQNESIRLYKGLGGAQWLEFAVKHRKLIEQFGRFPHRNAVLGRTSTEAETAFMASQGRGF